MFATQDAFSFSLPSPAPMPVASGYIMHNADILPFMTLAPLASLPHRLRTDDMVRRDSRWQQEERDLEELIDSARDSTQSFMNSFLRANGEAEHPIAWVEHIRTFLSGSGSRTVTISPDSKRLTITSLIHSPEDGPCLVLACKIPSPNAASSPEQSRSTKVITTALVAAFSILHSYALEYRLPGTIVLVAVSEGDSTSTRNLKYLLHEDGRRGLFRGDCVLACPSLIASPLPNWSDITASDQNTATRKERLTTSENEGAMQAESLSDSRHPLQQALMDRASNVLDGANVSMSGCNDADRGKSWCDEWSKLGIPVVQIDVARVFPDTTDSGAADAQATISEQDAFASLVRAVSFAVWDYMRAFRSWSP